MVFHTTKLGKISIFELKSVHIDVSRRPLSQKADNISENVVIYSSRVSKVLGMIDKLCKPKVSITYVAIFIKIDAAK